MIWHYQDDQHLVRIVQVGDTMAVWVNRQPLARFTDDQSPCTQGRVGLYAEDAYAQFADVRVEPAGPPTLNDPPRRSVPSPR